MPYKPTDNRCVSSIGVITRINGTTIADDLDLKRKSRFLYAALGQMRDPREKEILILRYGLFQRAPLTQREVADRLGISRSYVSRIEKEAIAALRTAFGVEDGAEPNASAGKF